MSPVPPTVRPLASVRAPVRFYAPKAPNYWLSNYHVIKKATGGLGTHMKGVRFASAEAMFQAAKFVYEGASDASIAYARLIATQSTPNKSRVLGRQRTGGGYAWRTALNPAIQCALDAGVTVRPDWDAVRERVMLHCLAAKFGLPGALQTLLLGTGDAPLVEASPRDAYWGTGKDGTGRNRLGALLEQTRAALARNTQAKPRSVITTIPFPAALVGQ
jgi:ribA/ribD-fused uncharacterized protein